ncbi:MAG: DUF2336 domain-containing protein [Hyphomicrobiales bacterium]|nr:DUF2336 domain-containing protein [Hyphomicrobiales bacterium]
MVVDRFFAWVRDASLDQRLRVVAPMARALADAPEGKEDRETIVAALTVLAADPEIAVRRAVAEALAERDDAPRHLLLDLIWDEPEVAEPIARSSEALIDAELIEAAAAHPDVALALARRRRVGASLASALAETVDRRGATALLANPGADVSAAAQLRLVDRFGEFADVREAFAARPSVPVTVRHRILEKLAETIGNLVVLGGKGREERGRALTRDAKDRATVALSGDAGDGEIVVLVDHLRSTGQLTTRLILRAACVGDLRFVEEAIARLADVPVRRVAALVADGRESAFRALYLKAGMPVRAFPAFAAALDVHRDLFAETGGWDGRPGDRARFSRRLVERVLTRLEMPSRRDADDLLALLRRFSADAAREQARALAAARAQEKPVALAAPVAEPVDAPADFAAEGPAETVFAEIRVEPFFADADADAFGPAFSFEAEIAEAAAADIVAHRAGAPIGDDLDEPVGLFSHVRLEDVPAEWLAEEEAEFSESEAGAMLAVAASALRGGLAA